MKNDVYDFKTKKDVFSNIEINYNNKYHLEYTSYLRHIIENMSYCNFRRTVILEYIRFKTKIIVNSTCSSLTTQDKDVKRLLKEKKIQRFRDGKYDTSKTTYLKLL